MSKEISPSMLPKLDECPLYQGSDGTSSAANRGTRIDIEIRNFINKSAFFKTDQHLKFGLESLNALEDFDPIFWGIEKLFELAHGSFIETREEYLAMSVPRLSKMGTADAICKDQKWVADIKTGQARNYKQQLAAYALACMEDNFASKWTAHVVYVDQRIVRSYEFTYDDAMNIVETIVEKSTSDSAKPIPCEYCSWCKHYNNCSAIVRQAESAIAIIPEVSGNSIEAIKGRILATPETLSEFAKQWKLVEKEIAEPLLELLKARLEGGEDISGWKLTHSSGRKFVDSPAIIKAAENISKETLVLALGGKMSEKNYLEFCSKNGVEPDLTAIKMGAPSPQLRQTKVK